MGSNAHRLVSQLGSIPTQARKLFCVVVRQACHGPMRTKPPGVATPAEILEACGLDVSEFYSLLEVLKNARLIEISGNYPWEQIRLGADASAAEAIAEQCTKQGVPLEGVLAGLDMSPLS